MFKRKIFRTYGFQRFARPTAFVIKLYRSKPPVRCIFSLQLYVTDQTKNSPFISACNITFFHPFKVRVGGLNLTYKKSSITLPPQAFRSSQDFGVVTLVYLTLNDVLSLAKDTGDKDDRAVSANTTIVSSTVSPKPPDVFNRPVEIVLQNKKVPLSAFKDLLMK